MSNVIEFRRKSTYQTPPAKEKKDYSAAYGTGAFAFVAGFCGSGAIEIAVQEFKLGEPPIVSLGFATIALVTGGLATAMIGSANEFVPELGGKKAAIIGAILGGTLGVTAQFGLKAYADYPLDHQPTQIEQSIKSSSFLDQAPVHIAQRPDGRVVATLSQALKAKLG